MTLMRYRAIMPLCQMGWDVQVGTDRITATDPVTGRTESVTINAADHVSVEAAAALLRQRLFCMTAQDLRALGARGLRMKSIR